MQKQLHAETVIIGAGISGIGVAARLGGENTIILEGREKWGGTWDLFKYPGIRSDSDMFTFAYSFHPWGEDSFFSPANSTVNYLKEVIDKYDIKIRYSHKVTRANFDTKTKLWTLHVDHKGEPIEITCRFVVGCTGYYDYKKGHEVQFPGQEDFQGTIVHPQKWPENFDYTNKKVVVIGSGATAITLVPNMVKGGASHVTMLQRSPTYIFSRADRDPMYGFLKYFMPIQWAYTIVRLKNTFLQQLLFKLCTTFPKFMKFVLIRLAKHAVGPSFSMKDFEPRYNPWEERLCFIPDNDIFNYIREGKAGVVTDHIDRLDKHGIRLKSGKFIDADIIITATGINLKFFSHIQYQVDGKDFDAGNSMFYRAVLVSGLPNYVHLIGYVNASWTLKVDISTAYLKKLIEYMHKNGYEAFEAVPEGIKMNTEKSVFPLEATYVRRATPHLPKQGDTVEWITHHDYYLDKKLLSDGARFDDKWIKFYKPGQSVSA